MEGYTNVIGSAYDFDDLDIEGRVVDEWNVQDEGRVPVQKFDEHTVLSSCVKLDNGQQAKVFTVAKKNNSTLYICHICSDSVVGVDNLRQHVQSQKHRNNLSIPLHPGAKFVKLDPKENLSLEPGEPVPPGLEEVIIKNCEIQPKLDAYTSPIIGLEYVVELTDPSSFGEDCYYYCLLCEKTGSERNMLIHLTSIYHNLKFLSIHFPTVARKLYALPNRKMKKAFGRLVLDIIGDIEAKYGRMKPFMEPRAEFDKPGRMAELQKIVSLGQHFREKEGEYFDERATVESLDKKAKELLEITVTEPSKIIEEPLKKSVAEPEKSTGIKEPTGSLFNKNNRINVDKKQLRSREDEGRNSSPDVQIMNIELPKQAPPLKKRLRSRSLSSVSTISSTSSRSKSRHNRHHSKLSNSRPRRWTRSRSRSPRSRYHRRSPYSRRHSPYRDRSPYRRRRSPDDRYREKVDRYGRSREIYDSRSDKNRRSRERHEDRESPVKTSEEKVRWDKFRDELKTIESTKLEKLKYYEKNPEKHPQYPEEWKSFWNRRYNELQRSGIDPSKHDFKPEWISFWTKRMKELYEEDLNISKMDLKKKFDLPEDSEKETQWKQKPRRRNNTSPGLVDVSPPTPDKKDVIADIKSTWKALTGSDIKDAPKRPLSPWEDDRSPPTKRDLRSPSPSINDKLLEDMPQRKTRTSSLIFVLRKLTVLEQQLGYLAPKVFELMQQALALEKIKEEASLDLLHDPDNAFYLETVREKLIGLLCAGVVPRNMVNTSRSAIKHIDIALYLVTKRERILPEMGLNMSSVPSTLARQFIEPPKPDPVVVPGVGQVDKAAIAQQIATALIEQGRTNVTEGELGQLINAVVGMAEASANSAQPMTTAHFLQQLQTAQNLNVLNVPAAPTTNMMTTETAVPVFQPAPQSSTEIANTQSVNVESQSAFGGLKLLQSAYNDSSKAEQDSPKLEIVEIASPKVSSHVTDEKLAATLALFNKTSKEGQHAFIQKLKISDPEMYKRLCPFIPISAIINPDQSKRSPIVISLSKEKSEQKIKALSSGRLSPFSTRSGGANPTVGEGVIDVDEDVKVITEKSSTPRGLDANREISSYKSNKIDLVDDNDDDDDDYSFEDVYKAAQESLKQKQLDEDFKTNQSTQNIVGSSINNKLREHPSKNTPHETATDLNSWNLESQDKNVFGVQQEKQQLKKANVEEEISQNMYSYQQLNYDKFREMPSLVTQNASYQSTMTPSQNYQERNERKSELAQNYPVSEDNRSDSAYSKPNSEGYTYSKDIYDKSRYPSDDPYYSNSASYSNQSRDFYPNPYEDSMNHGYGNNMSNPGYGSSQIDSGYNSQADSRYGNSLNMYGGGDPYKQRQQQSDYGNDNYGSWNQNRQGPSQRYPNSNYPPY